MESLLKQTLRCGISVADFWQLTPRETYMAIEAAIWQDERRQRSAVAASWLVAKLSKAKRIPPLKQLLVEKKGRKLTGAEKRKRQQEFSEMTAHVDLEKLPPLPSRRKQARKQSE